MAIIISKNGKNAKKIDKSVIETEDYLQKYIYDNPESIPIYEISDDIKVLIERIPRVLTRGQTGKFENLRFS